MAELLIKAVDATHPDSEKDRRGCYKRGMPVVVMPDGHEWGKEERLPKFVVIKLPGISVEAVNKYIQPDLVEIGTARSGAPLIGVYRKRLWKFVVDSMPAVARQKLASDGELTIGPGGDFTWRQVRNYLLNQRTGLTETEDL